MISLDSIGLFLGETFSEDLYNIYHEFPSVAYVPLAWAFEAKSDGIESFKNKLSTS